MKRTSRYTWSYLRMRRKSESVLPDQACSSPERIAQICIHLTSVHLTKFKDSFALGLPF